MPERVSMRGDSRAEEENFFRRAVLVDRKGAEREAVKHLRISMG